MSQPYKICPHCQTPAELHAPQCARCGRMYRTSYPGSRPPPQPQYYQAPLVQDAPKSTTPSKVFSIIAFLLLWFILRAYFFPTTPTPAPTVADAQSGVWIESDGWSYSSGTKCIEGIAVNSTGRRLSYASVTYPVIDANGTQVGSAMANVNQLQAGARWRFQALVTDEGAVKYGAAEVSWQE